MSGTDQTNTAAAAAADTSGALSAAEALLALSPPRFTKQQQQDVTEKKEEEEEPHHSSSSMMSSSPPSLDNVGSKNQIIVAKNANSNNPTANNIEELTTQKMKNHAPSNGNSSMTLTKTIVNNDNDNNDVGNEMTVVAASKPPPPSPPTTVANVNQHVSSNDNDSNNNVGTMPPPPSSTTVDETTTTADESTMMTPSNNNMDVDNDEKEEKKRGGQSVEGEEQQQVDNNRVEKQPVVENTAVKEAEELSSVPSSSLMTTKPLKGSTSDDATSNVDNSTAIHTSAAATTPSTNTTNTTTTITTTVNPKSKVSEKSPRKENDWLRSETSIGDGYSKIVIELEKLHMVLLEGGAVVQKKKKTALSTLDTSTLDNGGEDKSLPAAAEAASGTGASVMEKLGMWINGTKSPTTTVDTNDNNNNGSNDVQPSSNEMEGEHHQQPQQEDDEEEEVKQRLEIIKQHSKSLMTSQRSGFLGSNYDLPSMVSKELDFIEGQLNDEEEYWNKKNSDVDNEDEVKTKRKNDLDQARDTYESVKTFSVELASRLEHEIQKFTENRKVKITEGQRPSPLQQQPALSGNEGATTTTLDGVTNGDDQPPSSSAAAASSSSVYATATVATDTSTQQQKKKRKRVGAKCLTKVRQSWEMANNIGTTTSSSSTAARSTRNTRNRVQFLSSNSGTATTTTTSLSNLRNRDTYDKSLAEIIANVPDKDDTEDVTNGSSTMMKKAPHVSYEPINGVIPTMAPPMFDGQPAPPDYVAAFGRNKKRKRGGARDSTGSVADGGDTSEKPKSKRSRRDDSSATSSETEAALPSSSRKNTATNLHIRVLPDITPKPKVAYVEGDTNPTRLCNPLLRLPQFPDGPDPPIEEIPQGGELWNLADLHYYDPDTYPISYLARLLGFDVPEMGNDVPFAENFDPMTVKLMKDGPDSDPWAFIPNRGQFSESIRKRDEENCAENGKADDLKLSYCDPLWANIISSYRGFNEKDFKDAGKGFSDDLLPDCFNFAIERGIVSKEKGISFRFGTPEDEALLQPLADKCSWNSHQKHDLATSLRGQNSFCIVAQSAESGPIAFIQYSFCWYRVEEKISAASGAEKVSELVVFLDALVYDSSMSVATEGSVPPPISTDDLECVKTLLTSLALVHAARANIWYGMVDSPRPLVHFFTKYFRMSRIGRDVTDAVPLVFDLKKCHFRYAILLLEEDLKRKKESNEAKFVDSASERMLVRLPTNSVEIARTNVSSASKDSRSKKAHIRLVQDEDQLQIYSVSAAATAQEEECLSVFDPNSIDANGPSQWNVLRLFPSSDKISRESETSEASPTDGFLEELERKQKELETLEASIESTARCLLTKAYEEASDFHRNGRAAKKQQDENVLEEYAAVQKRLYEADLAWQAQLDQDMDAVCDICFDGEVTPENQIIFCDTCNVAVHQGCYGIEKVPSGNYFCRACTHFDIDKEFLAAERRRGPRTKPTRPHINCELCPRRNGAFVLVQSPESTVEPNDKPKKAKWVHVSCAKWHGMNYVDIELKDKIEDVSVLKNWFKSTGHQCCLCESGVGAMHQCRQEGCGKWLHLTCGRSIGTCSVQHGENCFGFYDETKLKYPPWTLACPKHSDVDPESIREDSLSLEQLVTIAKSYPPEPVPPKPFYKMNGAERLEYWADGDKLKEFFAKVTSNLSGAKCIVCEIAHDPNDSNSANVFCPKCGVFSHAECADPNRGEDGICYSCRFVEDINSSEGYQEPQCHMCNTSTLVGGPLMETRAQPLSMKKWKLNLKAFERSLFGPNQFCHTLCGL